MSFNIGIDAYKYKLKSDEDEMRRRVEHILLIAQLNKIDCLVLSAFGGGCFGNPSVQVARIFKELLDEHNTFDKVIFGIIDNTLRNKITNNYQIYSKVLS